MREGEQQRGLMPLGQVILRIYLFIRDSHLSQGEGCGEDVGGGGMVSNTSGMINPQLHLLRLGSYPVNDRNISSESSDSFDSDYDFRSGCRNVNQCHHKQSFSGLHST